MLLPISIAFLAFISFARLAMNWDCSQATIMTLEECSMVLWKWDCKTQCYSSSCVLFFWNQSSSSCSPAVIWNPHQTETCQGWMLPQGVIEDVLHHVLSTVTFHDAHSGRFFFPWGWTGNGIQLQKTWQDNGLVMDASGVNFVIIDS